MPVVLHSAKHLDALVRVQVPHPHCGIVRRTEQRVALWMDLYTRNPVSMAPQCVACPCLHVPDLDRVVGRARNNQLLVEIHTHNAFFVARVSGNTLTGTVVPNLDRRVQSTSDQLLVVKCQSTHTSGVSGQRADQLAGLDVPDLDGLVVRTSH
ncbi:hypothetical protein OGAPHI_006149 [Ogataea philodendri]|uniref:Uncharacterized protein n=1 Tax=Ogataea philodendri TaxID=1378263 RepID=A0A9P8T1H8_9ASCO|nr:uncharacterized protein OGAPHI_006149 [Ogataea philodendri]KAH3661970.1 hypothetical protein OGAPHI_006149 [Ogataea philodendri]